MGSLVWMRPARFLVKSTFITVNSLAPTIFWASDCSAAHTEAGCLAMATAASNSASNSVPSMSCMKSSINAGIG